MTIDAARRDEIAKYVKAYKQPGYKMGRKREALVTEILRKHSDCETFLDIGCGRAESLSLATCLGYEKVRGYEVVDYLTDDVEVLPFQGIHEIPEPDGSWEVVSSFDVFEHLLEADVPAALLELVRVASKVVVLTVASFHSGDLHITVKPPLWWKEMIEQTLEGKFTKVDLTAGWNANTTTFEIWK